MLGNEDLVPIPLGKHVARIEAHPQSRHMGSEIQRWRRELAATSRVPDLRIRKISGMTKREAEVHALAIRTIQDVGWCLVYRRSSCANVLFVGVSKVNRAAADEER